MYEISVDSSIALTRKVRRWGDGGMWSGQRNIEKERLLGMFRTLLDVGGRLLSQSRKHYRQIPAGQCRPVVAEHLLGLIDARNADGAIILDETIRREIGNIITEVVIETARGGTTGDRAREIDSFSQRYSLLGRNGDPIELIADMTLCIDGPVPAQMPLADAAGVIAVLLEHRWKRQAALLDQR